MCPSTHRLHPYNQDEEVLGDVADEGFEQVRECLLGTVLSRSSSGKRECLGREPENSLTIYP